MRCGSEDSVGNSNPSLRRLSFERIYLQLSGRMPGPLIVQLDLNEYIG